MSSPYLLWIECKLSFLETLILVKEIIIRHGIFKLYFYGNYLVLMFYGKTKP